MLSPALKENGKKATNPQDPLLCGLFFIVKQDKLLFKGGGGLFVISQWLCYNNYYQFLLSLLLFLVVIITPVERPKLCCYYFKAISTATSSRTQCERKGVHKRDTRVKSTLQTKETVVTSKKTQYLKAQIKRSHSHLTLKGGSS